MIARNRFRAFGSSILGGGAMMTSLMELKLWCWQVEVDERKCEIKKPRKVQLVRLYDVEMQRKEGGNAVKMFGRTRRL